MLRRHFLSILAVLPVAACGFEPLYGNRDAPGDAVFNDFHQIKIATIPERSGQMLRNELLDRLNYRGEPSQPRYELKVTLKEEQREVLVRSDQLATATDLTLTASYELVDRASNAVLAKGTPRSINRFNVLASPYATLNSAEDARRRAAKQLAEDIRARLAVYFTAAKGK